MSAACQSESCSRSPRSFNRTLQRYNCRNPRTPTGASMPSFVTHLECTRCGKRYDHTVLQTLCAECARPLYPRYDLAAVKQAVRKEDLRGREASLWRYAELLPVDERTERI